jgi:hypothetical protein
MLQGPFLALYSIHDDPLFQLNVSTVFHGPGVSRQPKPVWVPWAPPKSSPFTSRNIFLRDANLLFPPEASEKRKHKLKRLVQGHNGWFMDVKCPACFVMLLQHRFGSANWWQGMCTLLRTLFTLCVLSCSASVSGHVFRDPKTLFPTYSAV